MKWIATIGLGFFAFGALALIWMIPVSGDEVAGDTVHMIPYDLGARIIEDGLAIELSWTTIEAREVTIVVQRSTSGAEGTWTDIQELLPGSTSYLDSDVVAGKRYLYRVRTFDDKGGEGLSAPLSVDTPDR